MMRHKFFIFIFLSIAIPAAAAEFQLNSTVEKKENFLVASYERSEFQLADAAIKGSGVKVGFHHAFEKFNLEIFLSTALNSEKSVQSSFTGLGSYLYYSILGDCCSYTKSYFINGIKVVSEDSGFKHNLQIGVGIDQYLLNGSKSVYSASGLGVALNYDFSLFDYRFKVGGRYSMMTASQIAVKGTFLNFGIVFPL